MKVHEQPNNADERRVLSAMIADAAVLGSVAARWDGEMMPSSDLNRVAGWCVDHFRRYGKPPKRGIVTYLEEWRKSAPRAAAESVEALVAGLSREHVAGPKVNAARMIDVAGKLFNRVRMTGLRDALDAAVETGRLDDGLGAVTKLAPGELGAGSGFWFNDEATIRSTFAVHAREPVITFGGGLGEFFRNALEREAFVAFCGPQKSGKTWYLLEMAYRAAEQRKRVAFFEAGDLSDWEVKELFLTRIARHPIRSDSGRWPLTVRWPTEIEYEGTHRKDEHAKVRRKLLKFKAPLDADAAVLAHARWLREGPRVKPDRVLLRMSSHPNSTLSVDGMRVILDSWERPHAWVPDVIVVDYADILAPIDKREEGRDRINTTWKHLRGLAQERRALVLTGTQVKATGYGKWVLGREDFADDNRKLSHCTGMIGINVWPKDKELGVSRLNWIVKRRGRFSPTRCCHVASCLDLAQVAVRSTFPGFGNG